MEKASKVLRRSSARLKGLSSGHSNLHMVVSQVNDVRQTFKAFTAAQLVMWEDIQKWSCDIENEVIRSTFSYLSDLSILWSDVQKEFFDTLKQFRSCFDLILEGERQVDQARLEFNLREEAEQKAMKDVQKSHKKMNPLSQALEIQLLKEKLFQAEKMRELAHQEVVEKSRENEAVRMIRVKEGFLKMFSSCVEVANKASIIFKAQKKIADEIPDIDHKSLHNLKYRGYTCGEVVLQTKESIRLYREDQSSCSVPFNTSPSGAASPDLPPPYSLSMSNTSRNTNSHELSSHSFRGSFRNSFSNFPSAPSRSMTSLNSATSPLSRNLSLSPSAYPNISVLSDDVEHRIGGLSMTSDVYQHTSSPCDRLSKSLLDKIPEKVLKEALPADLSRDFLSITCKKEECQMNELGEGNSNNSMLINLDSGGNACNMPGKSNADSISEAMVVQLPASFLQPLAKTPIEEEKRESEDEEKINEKDRKAERRRLRRYHKMNKAQGTMEGGRPKELLNDSAFTNLEAVNTSVVCDLSDICFNITSSVTSANLKSNDLSNNCDGQLPVDSPKSSYTNLENNFNIPGSPKISHLAKDDLNRNIMENRTYLVSRANLNVCNFNINALTNDSLLSDDSLPYVDAEDSAGDVEQLYNDDASDREKYMTARCGVMKPSDIYKYDYSANSSPDAQSVNSEPQAESNSITEYPARFNPFYEYMSHEHK